MDKELNNLQIINELFFLGILYHLIVFTDYTQEAEIKVNAGWSMLAVSLINFLWPNLWGMMKGLSPDIKEALLEYSHEERQDRKKRDLSFFEAQRLLLIRKYKL